MKTETQTFNPIKTFPQIYRVATVAPSKKRIAENAFKPLLDNNSGYPFQKLTPEFERFQKYDDKCEATVTKYQECLLWIQRYLPHLHSPLDLTMDDLIILKDRMTAKKLSLARINHIMTTLRMFLKFCEEELKLKVIDYHRVKITKLPAHEVVSLTEEELKRFLEVIDSNTLPGLRMRAFTEFIVSTGTRPTAGLSVDYSDIKWDEDGHGEVTVKGKGNKANILFITPRAATWIKRYRETRKDTNPALFVTFGEAKRMIGNNLHKLFKHYSKKSGFGRTINPQMLRRTMGTVAYEKGADVFTVQGLLNHSRVETTIKHYVGRNRKVLKAAHAKYMELA